MGRLPITGHQWLFSYAVLYHRTKSKILSEICPKLSKTVLKCVENIQNHLKYAFFRWKSCSKQAKKHGLQKKGFKRTVKATDGQWWAVCPSLAITGYSPMLLLYHRTKSKILSEICPKLSKTVLKCVENRQNHLKYAFFRSKILLRSGKKPRVAKKSLKGHLGPLMGSDGQSVHHCPSPAILMLFFTIAQNQKYWVKFVQNYPKRFWNVWKINKITWNMHSSAKNLAQIRQK